MIIRKILCLIAIALLVLPVSGCSKEEKSELDTIVFSQSEDGNFVISPSGNEKTYADILALYQTQWEEYASTKLSYVESENVFALEDVALPAYGSIYPGQDTEEVMDAVYQGSENYKSISDKGHSGLNKLDSSGNNISISNMESELVGLAMTSEDGGNLYISGIYGDYPFKMTLTYVTETAEKENENKLSEIELEFVSYESSDKLFYMWTDIRNRLISQLGEPPRRPPYQDEVISVSAEELMEQEWSTAYGINWIYKNYTINLILSGDEEGTQKSVQLLLNIEYYQV